MAWLGALIAFAVSLGLAGLLAWCGPVDQPRRRGMHTAPTPTAGGLAILGGAAAAVLAGLPAIRGAGGAGTALMAGVAVAFAHGLLGGVDDVFDLGARVKLVAQGLLALAFALIAHPVRIPLTTSLALDLPVAVSVAGTVLWMVVTVNAVNFMDGSNGLVAGALAIVLGGLGLRTLGVGAPGPPIALLGAAGACLGFLPWNFPKARLFQGDAGALFLGALVAGLAVVAAGTGLESGPLGLFAAPTALLPLLTDVLLTLMARARRGAALMHAHKDHLYQRWLAVHGGDHAALARRVWPIMGLYTAAAVSVAGREPLAPILVFAVGLVVAVGGWLAIDRSVRQSG